MKIDAHQHFWKLDRDDYDWLTPELEPIYRDFAPSDLQPLLEKEGIEGTVVVQATDTEAETEYLLSLAQTHDWILGVVGWVDMEADCAPDCIAKFAKDPKFVGIRSMIQGVEDDDWMLRQTLQQAISALVEHGLCFDALIQPRHLTHFLQFLENNPDLNVVIDHCAKPNIRSGQFQPWADQIKSIANNSTAMCKLSGLITEANSNWTADDIKPYANHILECFGPKRVLFGSDWPVLNLAGDYKVWSELAQDICAGLSKQEKGAVFGDNAYNFYLK